MIITLNYFEETNPSLSDNKIILQNLDKINLLATKKSPLLIIPDFHGLTLVFLVFIKLFEDLIRTSCG